MATKTAGLGSNALAKNGIIPTANFTNSLIYRLIGLAKALRESPYISIRFLRRIKYRMYQSQP